MTALIAGRNPPSPRKLATAHTIYTYYKGGWSTLQIKSYLGGVAHVIINYTTTNNQQPVGARMPTQTAYLSEELYQYVIETKEEEQSTSARIAELVEKGKGVEQNA